MVVPRWGGNSRTQPHKTGCAPMLKKALALFLMLQVACAGGDKKKDVPEAAAPGGLTTLRR